MSTKTWLRTALAPAVAILVVALPGASRAVSGQGGSLERTLFVSALDAKGLPVDGLGPDAFVVRENGVRREVLRVSPATEPIDLTILIDNSTEAREEISYVRQALPVFIEKLAPENRIALVGLAQRPTVLVPSTTDEASLKSRAEGLFALPDSGATLLDAIVEVSEGLMKREAPRAAIVAIFTDGTEFTNRYAKDVIAAVTKASAAVHLVPIGRFFENAEHADRERNFFISQAPAATGGSRATMLVANGLARELDRLASELTSQYKVVYARPDTLIPPDTIEVASGREGLTVRGTPARADRKGV